MPAWLIAIILALGKPALIVFLRAMEGRFPGITPLIEAIIAYLRGAQNKAEAIAKLHQHCEGLFCPADLKG